MAEATKYTVLAPADGGAWREVGTSKAQTKEQALQNLLDDSSDGGEFMVIPSRYWGDPLTVTVEHKRNVTVAPSKDKPKARTREPEPEATAPA